MSRSGPQERTLRPTATGPSAAYRAKGSGLSFLSEDMHNAILEVSGAGAAEGGEPPPLPPARRQAPRAAPSVPETLSLQITVPQGYSGQPLVCKAPIYGVTPPPGAQPGETVRVTVRTADAMSA